MTDQGPVTEELSGGYGTPLLRSGAALRTGEPTRRGGMKDLSGVRLSGFSLDVLDSAAPAEGWAPEETVEEAVRRYLADRNLRPPGWRCLPLPEPSRQREGRRPAVEASLSDAILGEVSEEAKAQGVSVEALVTHAVMYMWAAEHQPDTQIPARVSGERR